MKPAAIIEGALWVLALFLLVFLGIGLAGLQDITAPRLITFSALWIWAGLRAGLRADEAGTLHGLVAGLLGGALLYLFLSYADPLLPAGWNPGQFVTRPALLLLLSAWWGSFGGMIADIRRLIKAKRAANRTTPTNQ